MTSAKEQVGVQGAQGVEKKRVHKTYRFQGVGKHLDVLRECNDKIRGAEDGIVKLKERVNARIEEFRKATGQKELFDAKDEVQKRIEELQREKGEAIGELKQLTQEHRGLQQTVGEEKKKLNMKSTTELKNKLGSIDSRIREKPLSSKEEKEISAEKNRLIKLLGMQDIFREKDEKLREMEEQKKVKEEALTVKKQELEHQYNKLGDLNKKLGKIKKTAYPEEVKQLQEKINELFDEKKAAIERKREELGVMEKKAQEYELKSAEIEKAKEVKGALQQQERVIAELEHRKGVLERDLHTNKAEQLRGLKSALEMQKSLQKKGGKGMALPYHIVNQLLQFGIAMPQSGEHVETAVRSVERAAESEEREFEGRKEQLVAEIAKVSELIKTEQAKLEKMPRPVFPRFES